jgi:hypothetical protein
MNGNPKIQKLRSKLPLDYRRSTSKPGRLAKTSSQKNHQKKILSLTKKLKTNLKRLLIKRRTKYLQQSNVSLCYLVVLPW